MAQAPEKLGKYRILDTLGQGAMGIVYKGYDEDIKREVALKVLHRHLLDETMGEELALRFRLEAQAAAHCMHANIVTIFDYGVAGGFHYIAMEFVNGINLKALLQSEKRIPHRQAVDIIVQVLSALGYAHERGVVHRDIKPANIMLLQNGRVKVADFGVARMEQSDLTRTGLAIGTPSYMSPECLRGEPVDHRADLFAVGVVLGELLTGRRLVQDGSIDFAALATNLQAAIGDSGLCKKFNDLLITALNIKPALRYQSAAEFARQLGAILSPDHQHFPDVDQLAATVVRTTQYKLNELRAQAAHVPEDATLPAPIIEQITQLLTPHVGPMAALLVKRYQKSCRSLDQLLDALTAHIPNPAEQTLFKSSLNASGLSAQRVASHAAAPAPSPRGTPPPVASARPTEQQLATISGALAQYLGPLAPKLVARAQRDTTDLRSLCAKLAEHIPQERERNEFLHKVGQKA